MLTVTEFQNGGRPIRTSLSQ